MERARREMALVSNTVSHVLLNRLGHWLIMYTCFRTSELNARSARLRNVAVAAVVDRRGSGGPGISE